LLRRTARILVATGAVAATAAFALTPASAAPGTGLVPPAKPDRLTITVQKTGTAMDGTHTLECTPAGGSHPKAKAACAALAGSDRAGRDLFAPVPRGNFCTLMHGGPATARIQGMWHGRSVDARYDRSNGCEIARWDEMVPALPEL
jgi:hypothetical protein